MLALERAVGVGSVRVVAVGKGGVVAVGVGCYSNQLDPLAMSGVGAFGFWLSRSCAGFVRA